VLTQTCVEAFGQNGGAAQLTQVASEMFGSVSGVTTQAALTIIAAEVFAKITHAPAEPAVPVDRDVRNLHEQHADSCRLDEAIVRLVLGTPALR
jgi:hypothetical protein